MSLLDLQGMALAEDNNAPLGGGGSESSAGCDSSASLLLCNAPSVLSISHCH